MNNGRKPYSQYPLKRFMTEILKDDFPTEINLSSWGKTFCTALQGCFERDVEKRWDIQRIHKAIRKIK